MLSDPHWLLLSYTKGAIKEHFVSFRRLWWVKKMNVKTHTRVCGTVARWHPAVKCSHPWLAHRTPIQSVTGCHTTWFMTGNYGYGGDIISYSLPAACIYVCVCWHVCSWLISYAVWIQQRPSLFFCRTEDKACHNNISRSSSRRAARHMRSHTHLNAQAHNICTYGPVEYCLHLAFMLKFQCFVKNQDPIGLFSAQVGPKAAREQGWSVTFLDRANHQFTTVWKWWQWEAHNYKSLLCT